MAFSADGSRIVTGSADRTARVWDARPGTSPVVLKAHTGAVTSVAFGPDGRRVITGSDDGTCKLWDARSGAPLLEIESRTGRVRSVAFSPDGTRVVICCGELREPKHAELSVRDAQCGALLLDLEGHSSAVESLAFSPDGAQILGKEWSQGGAVIVWDVRTGKRLVGAPVPPRPLPAQISADGRWIAHIVGNRVELIPLQLDEEELSYRRLMTRPNYERYREGYRAATRVNNKFAAQFYLNLVPPSGRLPLLAEVIVAPLFARLLLRDDVLAALKARPVADPEVQAACLKLAEHWSESPEAANYNEIAWSLVRDPGQTDAVYRRGLRLAEAACRRWTGWIGGQPDNPVFLTTLGVAQYRCGLASEALATLTRSRELNNDQEPGEVAFTALAQHRLGLSDPARHTLARLRDDERAAAGRRSRVAGLPPRGRGDRARPRLPGRPVRTLIASRITRTSRARGKSVFPVDAGVSCSARETSRELGQTEHAVGPIRSI